MFGNRNLSKNDTANENYSLIGNIKYLKKKKILGKNRFYQKSRLFAAKMLKS
jgi:hypothetical protein